MLTPYDHSKCGSTEDTFNYYHSSCRIYVECTFGEIDMHWGIFWCPLGHKLMHIRHIIDGAMRLHNFIVNYRLKHDVNETCEIDEFELDCVRFVAGNHNHIVGAFGDGVNDGNRGRPSNDEQVSRNMGQHIRQNIAVTLTQDGLHRPVHSSWRRTECSHTRLI